MSLRSKWAAGPASAGRSEPDWQLEGAYLERYVTDPAAAGQPPDNRRPIFIATRWAAAPAYSL
jgi:hypothetical protein